MADESFLKQPYERKNGQWLPYIEVKVGKKKLVTKAFADTGCSTGLFVSKETANSLDLGEPISAEPAYVGVADGHSLACDVYAVEIEVAGESKVVELYAVDVERIEEGDSTSEIEPLLGQGFMSFYVASFDGKQKLLTMSR